MVSVDASDTLTIESLMFDFLDTVEYPGKDEEVKKLPPGVFKENMVTASYFC